MITQSGTFRYHVLEKDIERIGEIASSTGFFNPEEIDIAKELVQERWEKGEKSGYEFVFYEINGEVVAYTCYGRIPCTKSSFDLYWIVTHHDFRNQGIGKMLMRESERQVQSIRGKAIYIETSSREQYVPTQSFYLKNDYLELVRYKNFYDEGDDKIVYVKYL